MQQRKNKYSRQFWRYHFWKQKSSTDHIKICSCSSNGITYYIPSFSYSSASIADSIWLWLSGLQHHVITLHCLHSNDARKPHIYYPLLFYAFFLIVIKPRLALNITTELTCCMWWYIYVKTLFQNFKDLHKPCKCRVKTCHVEFLLKHQDSLLTQNKSKTSNLSFIPATSCDVLQCTTIFKSIENCMKKHFKTEVLDYALVAKYTI